jgi:signal transduction histidine kinase
VCPQGRDDNGPLRDAHPALADNSPDGVDYRALFERMSEGCAYCQMFFENGVPQDFLYLAVNDAFETLTGLRDVTGRKVSEVIPGLREADPQLFDIYGRVSLTGTPEKFEMFLQALQMWFSVSVYSPAKGYFVAVFEVITERKRAGEEKARLEAQLQHAQKMESVGRLAGGVAHDFNNMLEVILGRAELALQHVDPGQPLHEDLKEIQLAASRSADLTRQLLAFARRQIIAPTVLDLNETVEHTLSLLRRVIGEDIDLVWRPGKNAWRVKLDPSQLDQILANLCVNARDAIAGVGKVTIETENTILDDTYCAHHLGAVSGEYVRLAVSDNGCGMDDRRQARLFEPFFTTKAMGHGTGLGLSTVYGIVKQNDGFIDVCSTPGVGTAFTIYLRRHPDGDGVAQTPGAPDPDRRGHETILVVEDDLAVLQVTTRMLAGRGYTVVAASTPAEAARLAREYPGTIDLLVTDVVMPEMNGRDLAQHLLSLRPNLKCLFTSGYTADVIANHGALNDGVCFLHKPFSIHQLAAKVREALEGS